MITKVGVIYQDRASLGFLHGLRDRLECGAKLIPAPAAIGTNRLLTRKQVNLAWLHFQKKGVGLVVRFTDADRDRWQDVQRKELDVVPDTAKSVWICGVAVNNPEEWLALDPEYLAGLLGISREELDDPDHRAGRIKRALDRLTHADEGSSELVARIVREAPPEVFRRWLKDEAFGAFYSDCRAAATRADCETPNELDSPL